VQQKHFADTNWNSIGGVEGKGEAKIFKKKKKSSPKIQSVVKGSKQNVLISREPGQQCEL
jgi:hypothetical protein